MTPIEKAALLIATNEVLCTPGGTGSCSDLRVFDACALDVERGLSVECVSFQRKDGNYFTFFFSRDPESGEPIGFIVGWNVVKADGRMPAMVGLARTDISSLVCYMRENVYVFQVIWKEHLVRTLREAIWPKVLRIGGAAVFATAVLLLWSGLLTLHTLIACLPLLMFGTLATRLLVIPLVATWIMMRRWKFDPTAQQIDILKGV